MKVYSQAFVTIDYGHNASGDRIYRETIVFSGIVAGTDSMGDEAYLLDKQVYIAPNPTTGLLIVEIEGLKKEDEGHIALVNLQGQLLFRKEDVNPLNKLDLSSYASGVYFINLSINDRKQSWRIVKE